MPTFPTFVQEPISALCTLSAVSLVALLLIFSFSEPEVL